MKSPCSIYKWLLSLSFQILASSAYAQVKTIHLGLQQGMTNGIVKSMTQDDCGRIWLATEGGLHCWDGYRFTVYDTDNSPLTSNELNVVYADSSFIYVGTRRDGLYILNTESGEWKLIVSADGLAANGVTWLSPAADGGVWATCYQNGVSHIAKDGTITTYSIKNVDGLKEPNWTAVEDGHGKLYLGHVTEGFSIIDIATRKLTNYKYSPENPNGFPTTEANSMAWDSSGLLWIGTLEKIVVYDPRNDTFVRSIPANSHVVALCRRKNGEMVYGENAKGEYAIMEDRLGNLWTSDERHGVKVELHEKPLFTAIDTTFQQPVIKGLSNVYAVCQNEGKTWIASLNGLWSMEANGSLKEEKTINSQLKVVDINTLLFDKQGKLWLGTFGDGIYVFKTDGTLVKHFYEPSPDISMLMLDSKGRIWASSRQGLIRFDNTKDNIEPKLYSPSEGLPNSILCAVCEDTKGRIWVSGNGGISCLNPETGVILNYSYADGIPYFAFMERRCMRLDDGRILFGQEEGACIFDPEYVDAKRTTANFFISSLSFLNTNEETGVEEWQQIPQELWGKTSFAYDENSFRVALGVDDISKADAMEFQFRIVGLDDRWFDVDKDRILTINSLPSGSYDLQYRARLTNGEWGEPMELPIVVRQPWWWTSWMKLLYLAVIAALVWYFWSNYQQKLKMRRQLAERLAAMYALSPKNTDKPAQHKSVNEDETPAEEDTPVTNPITSDSDEKQEKTNKIEEENADEKDEESVNEETEMKMLDREFINRIDEVILDNINEQNLDIQFLTERMFTSHSTLYRRIKNLTGMSINEYVRKHRLTHAMQLLHEGHSIQDVSDQCGFNSVNYFRRCFKNEYGMLPSEV